MRGVRGRPIVVLVIAPVLALAACQSSTPSGAPGSSATTAPGGPTGAIATDSTSPGIAEASLPPGFVVGPGDLMLDDPAVGLDSLSSHRSILSVSFDGTSDGQAWVWSSKAVLVAASDPKVGELTITTTGAVEGSDPSWAALVGGVRYGLGPDGVCEAEAGGAAAPATGLRDVVEPASLLTPLVGGDAAGSAVVNGVEANQFTFDQRALGFLSTATASGKVSIATAGGYVVHYEVITAGGPDAFGDGISGTLTTTYDLTDIGQPVTVDLPEDCPPGLIVFATPADATDITSAPGFLRFVTQAGVEAAAGIVHGSAVLAHWTAVDEDVIFPETAHLAFEFEGVYLDVFINPTEGGTSVAIIGSGGG
jgi:hypothetical protein